MEDESSNDFIEVTPAMIQAGVTLYYGLSEEFEDIEDIVGKIFRAMWAARSMGGSIQHAAAGEAP